MKKIAIILLLTSIKIFSQVAIGKTSIDGAGILDFKIGESKGIILPYTSSISNPSNGTLTFDKSSKKVMYFGDGHWINMTDEGIFPPSSNEPEQTNESGFIIGTKPATAIGVLVLESNSRALILPKVNNASVDMFNPSPGTICYDLSTDSIAIFNGVVWSYWK
ncbi:hypothetical protein [Chryseobacterium sp. EO14]|uniref:hypothetical protein n=1 Tax=Chryseobacterium sp. EO14 TaxID=2950551 RepID=UPI002109D421|nr:hypothetical protein [Chryseobacterium sp. EO14]MCQ4142440.1 hypothetical protein [Chryseobacterium sp. EO14]